VSISLADAILETKQQSELLAKLEEIAVLYKLPQEDLTAVIREVPEVFRQHCKMIDTPFLTLPQHVTSFAEGNFEDESSLENLTAVRSDSFSAFVDEIRQAIANGESVSAVITSVMETLLFGLHFDRVLLLNASLSGEQLEGKMALGKPFGINPKDIRRPIRGQKQTEYAPDVKAFSEGEVQVFGDPIFEDGWPFAAIPVGTGDEAFGVIYADKLESPSAEPLDSGAQLALGILAELLDTAVASSS